ncbi:MAG: M50 family metallopeptidase [Anaerolineaceae bacterium]
MNAVGNTALTILEFVLAFGALIFLHEFGHFIFARLSKIEVEEFGIGYPPKIVRLFRAGGTDFTLNWIPFGGFCRMKGENGEVTEPGSFLAAKPANRLLTLLGGPVFNLMLGLILFVFLFTRLGSPDYNRVQISDIAADSPAAMSELQVGDIFYTVNGITIDSMEKLSKEISSHLGQPMEIVVIRGDQQISLTVTPRKEWPENQGPLGITITNPSLDVNLIQAIPKAALATLDQGYQLVMLPVRLISGQIAPSDARMVSVKGIYDIYAQVQTTDQQAAAENPANAGLNTLYFFAVISIALGYTNLLPIPALDGGRILFVLPELFFKKKVPPAIEGRIHMVFYALLLTLMVVLIINDIVNPVVLSR